MAFDGLVYTSVNWSLASILLSAYSGGREIGDEILALARLRPHLAWHDFRAVVVRRAPTRGEIILGFVSYGLDLARLLDELASRRR